MKLNVLVVGSGGREHALALALTRDPQVVGVHVGPGNPGTWALCQSFNAATKPDLERRIRQLDILDGVAVADLARRLGSNLVVIGPEAPLVADVASQVRAAGIACFGPSAAAAQLEGSKQFAKQVMADAGVPTAASRLCRTGAEINAALDEFGAPYVVKNDGLAAGKGVVVTKDRSEALAHGLACGVCVIEEYLDGPEVSLFAICDGHDAVGLIPAQDFKRVGDLDTGNNTGGMGAYAPTGWAPKDLGSWTLSRVVAPTLDHMAARGIEFRGLLYVGLALTSTGPKVVEFNARFGDPETEAILPLLITGLGSVLYGAAVGDLVSGLVSGPVEAGQGVEQTDVTSLTSEEPPTPPRLEWRDQASVTVVMAARGYPGSPVTGGRIRLPDPMEGVDIIHCGTGLDRDGELVSKGGRVLAVTAVGDDVATARRLAYDCVDRIDFPDGFCRRDIAQRAAAGEIATPTW